MRFFIIFLLIIVAITLMALVLNKKTEIPQNNWEHTYDPPLELPSYPDAKG